MLGNRVLEQEDLFFMGDLALLTRNYGHISGKVNYAKLVKELQHITIYESVD